MLKVDGSMSVPRQKERERFIKPSTAKQGIKINHKISLHKQLFGAEFLKYFQFGYY
jgi:hypothetical protein